MHKYFKMRKQSCTIKRIIDSFFIYKPSAKIFTYQQVQVGILLSLFFWSAKYRLIWVQIMFVKLKLEIFVFAFGKQHRVLFCRHKNKLCLNELFQALLALLTNHIQVVIVHGGLNNMDKAVWFKNTSSFFDLPQNAFF